MHIRLFKWLLIGIALSIGNASQARNHEEHTPSLNLTRLPVSDPVPMGAWNRLVIPIRRVGNLLLIEARIDTLTGHFVLDTGAPYLVLNKTYFRTFRQSEADLVAGVDGLEVGQVSRTKIERLSIGDLYYENLDADIANLSHIEDQRQVKLLGMLGTNLFTSFMMEVNVATNQLILYRLDAQGNQLWKPDSLTADSSSLGEPDLKLSFRLCDNKIFIPVEVASQKMNWILDTGAETNVVDAWAHKKVLKDFIINRRINLSGSSGESQEVLLGVMPAMSVGTERFAMQQMIVTSMQELSETCSLYIDGILGYSFLSQGIFTIHFMRKEFCLYLYNSSNP